MKESTVFERELVSAVKGRIQCRVMNADGVVSEKPWQRNLILDSGLDKVAYMPWASTFQWCVAGTGTTPTKVETSSQASQGGSTVTIQSGTFQFVPGHVDKLIYWPNANVEARITGFLTSQTVTVSVSQTVATGDFVLYNVDQTALVTPYSMNMRYQTGAGYCGTTFTGNTIRLLRTFDFYMELSPVLITEIGFKEGPAVTVLFSRILLAEALYLSPGQWLQVSYELTLRLEPQSLTPKTPTIVGWPSTSGNEKIQLYGIAQVDNEGITRPVDLGMLANEPYAPGSRLLGPGYGFINRWTNGAGSPIKIYDKFGNNPFINPREMAGKYNTSSSKNYIPAGVTGNAQWYSSDYTSRLPNSRADCMLPILQPPLYPTAESGLNGAWNGVDPYSNFPSPVPNYGQTPWGNWKDEISPDTVSPANITLTANGTNLGATPTYQWQKWNGFTFDNVVGANGSVLSVQPSDIEDGLSRFKVIINGNGSLVGLSDEVSVYSSNDTASPPAYVTSLENTDPVARVVGSHSGGNMVIDVADIGIGGRAAVPIKVFRNLVGLTHTSGTPGVGQFRVTTNGSSYGLSVDSTTGTVYYNTTDLPFSESLPSSSYAFTVNCENKQTTVYNVTYRFFARLDYGWITPSDSIFREGTGLVDVGGSSVFISENGTTPAAVGTAIDRSIPRNVEIPLVLEPYTVKAFTRVKKATFLTNMANGSNWRTIGIGGCDADITVANRVNAAKYNSYVFVFDSNQIKQNTHELSVFFRYSWRRDFT
jgi:hypothetical protein